MMTKWNPHNPADLGIWDDLGWMQPLPERKAKKCLKLTKKKSVSEGGENSVTENSCFVRALKRTSNPSVQKIGRY